LKKIWYGLPTVVRWLLVTVVIMAVAGAGVYAYIALTATVEIVIEEPLSFVGENVFEVTLYPQETVTQEVTIANASSLDFDVNLVITISPEPEGGLNVDVPKKVTVPANGEVTVTITIKAGKSAPAGAFAVEIGFDR